MFGIIVYIGFHGVYARAYCFLEIMYADAGFSIYRKTGTTGIN
jgi:hypothetical protein